MRIEQSLTILNKENFDAFVSQPKAVVFAEAKWCRPCVLALPVMEEIQGRFPDINFGDLDVDYNAELAQKLGILSIPALIYFQNGEQLKNRFVGNRPENEVRLFITKSFKKAPSASLPHFREV